MNIALLTAAGSGNRMGQDVPKQFMSIDNIPVIIYTLMPFQKHPEIDAIAVVCLKGWEAFLDSYARQWGVTKLRWIFPGGATNQESIRNGLYGLRDAGCSEDDIVLVQDGVRPLVNSRIISENIAACKEYGYAVTGLVCKEAIMRQEGDNLCDIEYSREELIRTQTPHTYHLGTLLNAHKEAEEKGIMNTVASCTLLAKTGIKSQHLVRGSERNGLKLTRPEDIELFQAMIRSHKEDWM